MIGKISALLFALFALLLINGSTLAEEKWKALDEAVIEKIAEERGKSPRALFELEGDLELFLFTLLAGISGFISGYFWRKFLDEGEGIPAGRGALYQAERAERKG